MITGWHQVIIEPVKTMLNSVAEFIPQMLGALLILLVGWIVAKVLAGLFQKILDQLKFNEFAAKIGLADLLIKGNVGPSAANLLSGLLYWALMIVVFAITVDSIGLTVAAKLLEKVTSYIPNVVSAVFVALVGMFLANLISGIIKATAANANVNRPEFLGSIAKGAILVFATVMALDQLNISTFFVSTTFQIFFAAVCFALALAFGLGGKDLAAKLLWDFYNKQNVNK
ncbi:MAG: hypothetical protein HQL16_02635 [Candidatus Omnitrophica bacterium]|nr:hypothetical protein [Candidatus Omnitrophota bacterium]